ncbi:MAG: phosphoribosyltransferase family protein [Oscillospiraceae bacterium]|jgi:adenine phosphoribosyltransferase
MSQNTYTLKVAGLTRELALCPVNESLDIAAFVMFSDVELTIACATELLKVVPEHDVLITAESKGIPLAYEMSRQSGKRYLLARKSKKLYMKNTVEVPVNSITTANLQKLYLDADDMAYLKGKRVLLVDDVISTGESIHALEQLVNYAKGEIVGKACVLAEGDAAQRKDIIFLEPLPLFFK